MAKKFNVHEAVPGAKGAFRLHETRPGKDVSSRAVAVDSEGAHDLSNLLEKLAEIGLVEKRGSSFRLNWNGGDVSLQALFDGDGLILASLFHAEGLADPTDPRWYDHGTTVLDKMKVTEALDALLGQCGFERGEAVCSLGDGRVLVSGLDKSKHLPFGLSIENTRSTE